MREREREREREESMSSRERKKAALYRKFRQLRSATNSTAVNKTSILVDASKYIEELKEKVERLNQDVATSQSSSGHDSLPMQVTVDTLEKGFLINVFSEKNCPGLLVSILKAFEELGLDVLDASISCSDSFRLEAVGGENEGQDESLDAQVVKQAVLQAIRNWAESNEQD
ncbi:transcription factor SCREAM2-like isoform X1 [Actinidia eriantha]|uniref:transcription factor SCREAM2-like isoform X1 n=2 Tax=Actinidia eriantha TaxID=165200 RepID=UPI00258AB61B|nr:transcription factor SCREAM2-like isoform X1 [Actinidia eriantha]